MKVSMGPYCSRTCRTERRSAKVKGMGETSTRMVRWGRDCLARLAAEDMMESACRGREQSEDWGQLFDWDKTAWSEQLEVLRFHLKS